MLPGHTGPSRQGSLAGSPPGSSPRSPQGDEGSAGGLVHDLRRRIHDLEGQLAQTTANMHVAEGGRDVATRGQNDLAKTVRRLTRDLRDLERQVGELQAERNRLQTEVASLLQDPETTHARAAEIAALQDRVGRRDMEIADMARVEDILRRDLGILVAEREDLAAQIATANDEVDRLQAEVGAAKIEIEELQYTLRLTEGSLAYAQRSVGPGHSGSATAGSQPDTSPLDQVRAERESARSERDEARAALDKSSHELAALRSELDAVRAEHAKVLQELTAARSDHDSTLRQRDTAIEDLDRVAQGLTLAETENCDLRTYCSPLSSAWTADLTPVVFAGAKLGDAERAIASLQEQASDLSRRQDDLVRDLASTVRTRDEVRAERDDALGRLAIVATAMQGSAAGSKLPLPPAPIPTPTPANTVDLTSESTAASASGPKRSRDPSPNPDPPSDSVNKRPRPNSPVVVPAKPAGGTPPPSKPAGGTPPPSPGSGHGDTPPPSPGSDHGSPIRLQRPRRPTGLTDSEEESSNGSDSDSVKSDLLSEDESSEDPEDAEINDDALEQDTLRALSMSRAADRRLRHASPTRVPAASVGSGSTAGSGSGPAPSSPAKPATPQTAKPKSGSSTHSGGSKSSGPKGPKSGSGSVSKARSKDSTSKPGSAKLSGPASQSGSTAKTGSSSKAGSGSGKKDSTSKPGSGKPSAGSASKSGSSAKAGSGSKTGSGDSKSGSGAAKPSGKAGSGSGKASTGSTSKSGSSAKTGSGDSKSGSGAAKSSGSPSKSGSAAPTGSSSDPQQDPLPPAAPFGPDDSFIPGRFRIRTLRPAEVEPWIVAKMNNVSIASLVIGDLFPIFPTQPGWMFPCSGKAPDPSEYCRDLVTAKNVQALLDTRPWEVLEIGTPQLSFDPQIGGGLGYFLDLYLAHENRHLQAYWEATHSLPIEGSQDPELLAYRKQRANRRSHAGNSWKQVLMALIPEMLNGWCDLDLLLDLPFLHFPKRSDKVAWYPGFEARKARQADPNLDRPDPTDLLEALDECNADDPWRNHFRDSISDHPAHRIPRLSEKFLHVKARSSGKLTKSEQTVTL